MKQITWFKALPASLAFRLVVVGAFRRAFKLPIAFSFAQGAEDILLGYLLPISEPGTYMDVGCNEPVQFSNTFNLYLLGWRGINIDANEKLIAERKQVRKQDISLCAAVSDSEREVVFRRSETAAESTIDEIRLAEWKKNWTFKEEDQLTVVTRTLTSILDTCLSANKQIDLLTVDVEGHDFNVLTGLDFDRYRPKAIVIEMHSIENIQESPIYQYLTEKGYDFRYYAVLSAYFSDGRLKPPAS